MMDALATIARQRTVIATIADVVVAAAVGKSLRVAVGWSNPDEAAFADQLTRALLARGMPCRCLRAKSNPAGSHGCTADNTLMVAVITSGTAGADESDLCRINIQLQTPTRSAASGDAVDDGHWADIVVDYLDPGGPTISRIAPALTRPSDGR